MASMYNEIGRVMDFLTRIAPCKRFDRNAGQIVRSAWVRGGTSQAGADMGATGSGAVAGASAGATAPGQPAAANYYVGAKYLRTDLGAPQRIVWVPPEPGAERLGPPDKQGWTTDEIPAGGPPRAYRAIATRLSPWTVELWTRDHDDAIELGDWLVAAYHLANPGRTIIGGQQIPAEGMGWVPDESLQEGVKWRVTLWFAWPVVIPYLTTAEMRGDATTIDVVAALPEHPAGNAVGAE